MSGAGPHRSSKQKGVSNFVVRGTFFCLFVCLTTAMSVNRCSQSAILQGKERENAAAPCRRGGVRDEWKPAA
jgi:hypothetical protein